MPITYTTTIRNNRLQQVLNAIDASGNGRIEVGTTGMGLLLATFVLSNPSGTISSGILTFSNTPITVNSAPAAGIAAAARILDGSGALVGNGLTVGSTSSGADVILSNINVRAGDVVTLVSARITGN